ncbi:MAG: cell division protein ZapA [Ignavibacteriales bacterium]|jgi:cell division protein ZapA (FtsZ GTPase activity inhibitor)|nr:cell division protein ZapA [Ignavibacteriales bacterium]
MSEKQKVKIKIFGREYSLLVENEEIAKELAAYVDKTMQETRRDMPDQSEQTVAVIASLNIAYDYFRDMKMGVEPFLDEAEQRLERVRLLHDLPSEIEKPSP